METVRHHGRETAYRKTEYGDGDSVLYVHGSGGTHSVWAGQYGPRGPAPAVAVDLSGHGESDDVDTPAGEETLEAYADDVVAVAEETGARVVAGNSLGGAVTLWLALERDLPLDGLVLCGTGAKLGVADRLLDRLAGDFDAAVEAIHGSNMLLHDDDANTLERSTEMFSETGREVTERDFRTCNAFDVRDRMDEVDAPALAVTGEHDELTPPRFSEYFAAELADCELALLPDAAHLSMVERPDAWNEAVADFLARKT